MQLRPITLIQASLAGLIVTASGSSSLALTEAVAGASQSPQSPTLVAQAQSNACDLDTRLAARVVRNTLFERTYSTRSIINLEGSATGLSFNMEAQVTTLTQAPGKFRSEIVFQEPGNPETSEFLVMSNGEQAWVYDKIGDRYFGMSHQDFDDSDDAFLIGLTANMGLMIQSDFSDIKEARKLSEAEFATVLSEAMGPCQNSKLTTTFRTVNGQTYQTFEFEDQVEGFTMTGLMNRQTSRLDYFSLSGQEDGIDFEINEQIISRTAMPETSSTAFEFIPPATAEESAEPISIGPF